MNILHKVTIQTLKKNKVRTLVTIIGIILSAAMITAVVSLIGSLQNYMLSAAVYESGDWHGCLYNVDETKLEELREDDRIAHISVLTGLGYIWEDQSVNSSKPYLYLASGDETFLETMPIHLVEGRMPADSTEVILPKHLQNNGGVYYNLGDVLEVDLGDRFSQEWQLTQNNMYYENQEEGQEEELIIKGHRSLKVVGFYERPSYEQYIAPGYTAMTAAGVEEPENELLDVYVKFKNPSDVDVFIQENCDDYSFERNSSVLTYSGVSLYDTFYVVLYSLGAILIGLIMFGSVSLIYNAFSISISDRTKQFGLLSSIGATRKQIRRMVFYEAFLLSVIGIPIGIASGLLGIKITLMYTGNLFRSFTGADIPMELHYSLLAIIIAGVITLTTVMISAWVPSKRAAGVTAIEAIRQSSDVRVKGTKVRKLWGIYRLFGLEGLLANRYFSRDKKKYRTTILSLFMSIVLFISATSFCDYMKESIGGIYEERPYEIIYYEDSEEKETVSERQNLLQLLSSAKGVERAGYASYVYGSTDLSADVLTDGYKSMYQNEDGIVSIPGIKIWLVDDASYKAYLDENGLDPEIYLNADKPVGIASSYFQSFNPMTQRYEPYSIIKDEVETLRLNMLRLEKNQEEYETLSWEEQEKIQVEQDPRYYTAYPLYIGLFAEELAFGPSQNRSYSDITVMYPESLAEAVLGENPDIMLTEYTFKTEDASLTFDEMFKLLEAEQLPVDDLQNLTAGEEADRDMLTILNVFSYGFIILISLIAIANVFNTISTNISLRRRELAMLRSVGMTRKGFRRLMNLECIIYGMKALALGIPVSLGITWLIFRSVNAGWETVFRIPWYSIGIAVLSVFVVVFTTMLYSMNKINQENTVDALKNENL